MAQDQAPSPGAVTAKIAEMPGAKAPVGIPAPAAAAPSKASTVRRILLPLILLAVVAYVGRMGYDWFTVGRFLVSTDDAYVGAETAIIAAKISGHVVEVAVAQNQHVRTGDLLVRIDAGDYQLAVDSAKAKIDTQDATIERIGRQVEAQRAVIAQAEAQVALAQAQSASADADHQRAELEFQRSQKLADSNFGSQQRLEQAAADRARTTAALAGAKASVASAEASLAGAKSNLDVLQSQRKEAQQVRGELVTAEQKAERDLSFTDIRAPFDGVVGNKAVEVGQYAQPGVRLMALVALDSVYVDANFKETQLGNIRPGQRVDISVDAMDGRTVSGIVKSIAPASGAEFALIPPDNATGNFTKVVQRIPVRITLEDAAMKDGALRPGMSVVASIHTRDDALPKPTLLGALGIGAEARP